MSERDPFDYADSDSTMQQELKRLRRRVAALSRRNVRASALEELSADGGAIGSAQIGGVTIDADGIHTSADQVEINWWLPVNLAVDVVDSIYAMAYDGSEYLYVGGVFSRIGGVSAKNIARYSLVTRQWSALGTGADNIVYSIAVSGGNVYVGGAFGNAGGTANTACIAKWNGSAWSAMGTGANGPVRALAIDGGGNVYAGGEFSQMSGVANTSHIAKWNGSAWSAMGTGVASGAGVAVFGIGVDGSGNVFIGGEFYVVGGTADTAYIAKWNGTAWSSVGVFNNRVLCFKWDAINSVLYAGGRFSSIAGATGAEYIAKYDGANWSAMGGGLSTGVFAIEIDSLGNVIAAGDFTNWGGDPLADRIAVWDGETWSPLTNAGGVSGLSNTVYALFADSYDSIYAGGSFDTAGSIKCQSVAVYCRRLSEAINLIASLFELYADQLSNGFLNLGAPTALKISGGAITATKGYHQVDTEGGAATDDLDTIKGGTEGNILILASVSSARDTTLKDDIGNLRLAGDFTLTNRNDRIMLMFDGTNWIEVSRSDNN